MSKTKVHRVVLLIVDDDDIGEEGIRSVIPGVRYPNRCIAPQVMSVETREVAWDDHHPLNSKRTQREAFDELFAQDEELAKMRRQVDEAKAMGREVIADKDRLRAALTEALAEILEHPVVYTKERGEYDGWIAELRRLANGE